MRRFLLTAVFLALAYLAVRPESEDVGSVDTTLVAYTQDGRAFRFPPPDEEEEMIRLAEDLASRLGEAVAVTQNGLLIVVVNP